MSSITVIGSGNVGQTLAKGLHRVGHEVTMGRRDPSAGSAVEGLSAVDLPTAVEAAEIVINATPGASSVELFTQLADAIGTRVVVDVSNAAKPGTAAALQRVLPQARVVKTLNTVLYLVMTAPDTLSAPATLFLSGNDPAAKDIVRTLLISLGWRSEHILDIGDIDTASATEAAYPLEIAALRAHGMAPVALTTVF